MENNKLRGEIQHQILENTKLAQQILNSNTNQITQQDQINKLENENQALLNRVNELVQAVNEAEHQLEMETQLRKQISVTFEEHDKEKEEIIMKYESTIKEQCKLIENIKMKNAGQTVGTKQSRNTTIDSGTQTNTTEHADKSKSLLLVEIEQVKIRLCKLEDSIGSLHRPQHKQQKEATIDIQENHNSYPVLTPEARQPRRKKLTKPTFTITEKTENKISTPGNIQNRRTKLNRGQSKNHSTDEILLNKSPVRSASLQVARYKAALKTASHQTPMSFLTSCHGIFKAPKGPPETAKLLGKNENLDNFYSKHIEEAIRLKINNPTKDPPYQVEKIIPAERTNRNTPLNTQSRQPTQEHHFLDRFQPQKERHKPQKSYTRILWNTAFGKIKNHQMKKLALN